MTSLASLAILEAELATPLFVRSHRKVEPTAEGQRLAKVLAEAFGRVAETIEAVRQPMADETVVVGTTLALAHFWLLPRLPPSGRSIRGSGFGWARRVRASACALLGGVPSERYHLLAAAGRGPTSAARSFNVWMMGRFAADA